MSFRSLKNVNCVSFFFMIHEKIAKNMRNKFSTMLYESFPAEARLTVYRRAPVAQLFMPVHGRSWFPRCANMSVGLQPILAAALSDYFCQFTDRGLHVFRKAIANYMRNIVDMLGKEVSLYPIRVRFWCRAAACKCNACLPVR